MKDDFEREFGRLVHRITRLSDGHLVEMLQNRGDYRPEAIAIAEEEAAARGGLEVLKRHNESAPLVERIEHQQRTEEAAPPHPSDRLKKLIQERFVCCKCKGRELRMRKISAAGQAMVRSLNSDKDRFLALSCWRCGHTEIYDAEILESRSDLEKVLNVLFG